MLLPRAFGPLLPQGNIPWLLEVLQVTPHLLIQVVPDFCFGGHFILAILGRGLNNLMGVARSGTAPKQNHFIQSTAVPCGWFSLSLSFFLCSFLLLHPPPAMNSGNAATQNEPSILLSDEENQIIFTVVGARKVVSGW